MTSPRSPSLPPRSACYWASARGSPTAILPTTPASSPRASSCSEAFMPPPWPWRAAAKWTRLDESAIVAYASCASIFIIEYAFMIRHSVERPPEEELPDPMFQVRSKSRTKPEEREVPTFFGAAVATLRRIPLAAFAAALLVTACGHGVASAATDAPRVVVNTDGEGDDIASMHRLLLYTNDLDVEGIVATASRWHWAGDPSVGIPANTWHGTNWIPTLIDNGYRQAYPTLVANDPRYPRPERLLGVVKTGNIGLAGEMAKDTEGSNWIKQILLDDKPGPVYLLAWGGTNTIAAALRSIRDEYQNTSRWNEIQRKVSDKAVIYIVQDQDTTYKDYIATAWPDVRVIINRNQFDAFSYGWAAYTPEPLVNYFRKDWIAANILKGPLMADYPINAGAQDLSLCSPACALGDWFSEGDSPSFIDTIPTGLR